MSSQRFPFPLHMRRSLAALLGLTLLAASPMALPAGRLPPVRPALVVVVTVDQLRADYLARWEDQWTGGFHRLLTAGAVFEHGLQDHALTETAPGHATILSGREPASTGIVSNALGVGDTTVLLVGTQDKGASPRRFVGSTLVDWMRSADSGLRVLSISPKDRSAILPVGGSKSPVFWFAGGRFTTSTWYADTLAPWVGAWNARGGLAALIGHEWRLLLPDSRYAEPDSVSRENRGKDFTFPHRIGGTRGVTQSPWMDSLTLDLALEGSARLGLGQRGRPDLLAVGLSATDAIGHDFGPDSREIHDHLLRVDRWLGWFLDSLETQVGKGRLLVVLTADHGVTPFPELVRARGGDAGYIGLGALVREANQQLVRQGGSAVALKLGNGLIHGDRKAMREAGISPESLATALVAKVWRVPGVRDAWTPATLNGVVQQNVHAARWQRNLPRRFPWLVAVQPREGWVYSDSPGGAQHGSSRQDDVAVPIAFLGAGIRAGRFADTVRTVDIAPTLARLLAVKAEGRLDGRPIRSISR